MTNVGQSCLQNNILVSVFGSIECDCTMMWRSIMGCDNTHMRRLGLAREIEASTVFQLDNLSFKDQKKQQERSFSMYYDCSMKCIRFCGSNNVASFLFCTRVTSVNGR